MKKVGIIIAVVLAIILGCGFYFNNVTQKPLKGKEVTVVVEPGDTLYGVLNTLKKDGLLKNRMLLGIYVKVSNLEINLKPGTFTIPENATLKEIKTILESDLKTNSMMVTIPEGYDIEAMATLFEENGLFSKDEFLAAVKEHEVPSYIPTSEERKYDLEGFLFPDTYAFDEGITPKEVIDLMLGEFEAKINELMPGKQEDIYKIITMASIVEKEAVINEERPKIASVFYNRLNIDMKFQSCATVIYALGEHKDVLLNEDLLVESPYNTYNVNGYPAGPIASPGEASIKAALNPEDTDYLYFVAKNDGSHVFSTNLEDHNKAKAEYQGF